jgi:hypothetical protein
MDPQDFIAQLLQVGDSSGRDMPTMRKLPELPPDYQIQSQPYRGAEIPMQEFDPLGGGRRDPVQQRIGALLDHERRYNELKAVDPRMAERFKSFGLSGPSTDGEIEWVYGPNAVAREMRGGDPLAGSMGMDQAQVGRQPVYPLDRRFRDIKKRAGQDAESEAELQQEQEEREMDEQEPRGIYR